MTEPKPIKKRRPARDSVTGKFEQPTLLDDPQFYDQVVVWVRAITDLEPLLAGMAMEMDEQVDAKAVATVGAVLSVLKQSFLEQLAADPESLKEAKKKRLDAKRLGCVPMSEHVKVMDQLDKWMALPAMPRGASLARTAAKPAIEADDAGGAQ